MPEAWKAVEYRGAQSLLTRVIDLNDYAGLTPPAIADELEKRGV